MQCPVLLLSLVAATSCLPNEFTVPAALHTALHSYLEERGDMGEGARVMARLSHYNNSPSSLTRIIRA